MQKTTYLGDLQLAIMRVLWDLGEATVTDVHQALLDERGLAPTTIATMLKKMEEKGVVTHRAEGRKFIYQPTISEDMVTRGMVSDLTERLFGGDPVALVSHLISRHEIRPDELSALEQMIADAKKKEGKR
ncbi:BlaI/MecI/CopY family transcriptional regulator [Polyangium aurulentum]|uniref:BlaI/MecI/CopY family transcriptional regulator n=1 Tax=Polyangium aurulentum TaxID=2567896 RepID=UPI0010ADD057|nr:BlaI/MecI/CopY family transcriptional regulator [Polyangium aurulentum]UQA61237.1 BlaI/MecI/CopY family transcriptional regulator [Polyangium aurulentum]